MAANPNRGRRDSQPCWPAYMSSSGSTSTRPLLRVRVARKPETPADGQDRAAPR